MTRRRVLVTNDDGVESPGLHALAAMAQEQGYDVTVAAPAGESSGSSAAAMATEDDGRIPVGKRVLPGLPDVPAYAVAATPALIVLIARRGAFGDPPELVLSGVNRGSNVGYAVIHSGTVGAALTAVTYGCPALAVSLDVASGGDDPLWTSATGVAVKLLEAAASAAERVALNLNVPNLPLGRIRGLRGARLASFGAVQAGFERGRDFVRMTLQDDGRELEAGTDAALLAKGFASVTALHAVTEAEGLDLSQESRKLPNAQGSSVFTAGGRKLAKGS
jgi:5'-nucleotidase